MAKHKRQSDDEDRDDERNERSRERPSRARWFLPRFAVMVVLLGVCVWFAPVVVARTSLWKSAVAYIAPGWERHLDAKSVSLGWLSPVVLDGVIVRNAEGQSLLEADRVASDKTLLQLIQSPGDVGKFSVAGPKGTVVLRSDGSNVEDFLASLPSSSGSTPGFELDVAGGQLIIQDEVSQSSWTFDRLSSSLAWPASGQRQGTLNAAILPSSGAHDSTASAPGEIICDFTWTPSETGPPTPTVASSPAPNATAAISTVNAAPPAAGFDLGAGTVHAVVRGLPAESLAPLTRRLDIDIQAAGAVHADLNANWSDGGKQTAIDLRQLRATQIALASNRYLAGDQVRLSIEAGHGQVALKDDRLIVDDLEIASNLFRVRGSGSAAIRKPDAATTISPILSTALPDTTGRASPALAPDNLEIAGQLNIASLATQLPRLFHLRQDVRLTGGTLGWTLQSKDDSDGHRWQAAIRAEGLTAETPQGPIGWQPVALSASVVQSTDGWRIEQLRGESRFLQLEGSGTLREGGITASANLNQLVADLNQIVDWRGAQLAGNVGADLRWRQGEGNAWQASASADVRSFQFYAEGMMPWREDDLRLQATVDGTLDGSRLRNITSGRASIVSGSDRCETELTAAVIEPSASTPWPLRFVVQGDLATWLPRVQALFPTVTSRPAGTVQLVGSGKFSSQLAEFETTTLDLTDLSLDMAGLAIREPKVKLETSGQLDLARRKFSSPATTLASTALALRAENALVDLAPGAAAVNGTVDFRGDLGRMTSWISTGGEPRAWLLGGSLTGSVEAKYQTGVVIASWNTEIENLSYLTPSQPQRRLPFAAASISDDAWLTHWTEPKVALTGRGQYDPKTDNLQVSGTRFESSAAGLTMAGSIDSLRNACIAELQGEVFYDGAGLTEKLRPILGQTFAVSGREQRKFALRGPLLPPPGSVAREGHRLRVHEDLQGQSAFGWQEAKYVGLTAGAAEIPARLERGVVTVGPLNVPVSEGRITATPQLALNTPVPTLYLGQGKAIDQVRLSPEICHTWLKYVAPLLADVTRAEGKFSVDLRGAAIPLAAANKSDIGGTLAIHRAEVGPGPLAQQYLAIARQVRSIVEGKPDATPLIDPEKGLLMLPEQQVDFQVVEGRVHHRGLRMTVKDVVITTRGSVGFDQTIDLVADIPVQESWIKPGSPLAAFRGQSIAIPIRGDLTQPKPDTKALAELGSNLVRGAAQNMIQNELNKGIQKLFGPPPSPTPR